MQRTIKFRAWDKEAKLMLPNVQNHIGTFDTAFGSMLRNERYDLTQYTGLHDRNGTEIYEGDILRYIRFGWRCAGHPKDNTDLVTYYKVIWDEAECAFKADNKDMTGSLCFDDSRAKRNEIEVIGSIYENPELLGGKETT